MNRQRENLGMIPATVGVLLLAGALYGGIVLRDHVDAQGANVAVTDNSTSKMDGLLASTQKESKDIPLIPYYDQVEQILKDRFVEPINNEQKLASGAVKGMISSLGDAHSRFFDPTEFKVVENINTLGAYEGIGAVLVLNFGGGTSADDDPTGLIGDSGMSRIPRLEIGAVAPGGPADKAGLKPGDFVDTIDGHWVINPTLIETYRKLAAKTKNPNAPELVAMRKTLRVKADAAILPTRGWDRLMLGSSGKSEILIERRGVNEPISVSITKGKTEDPGNVTEPNGIVRLRFNDKVGSFLKSATEGKAEVQIDLRSVTGGTVEALKAALAAVAPAGTYGGFKSGNGKSLGALTISSGSPKPPKLTILVDRGTRGMAQIFALALASKGIATLSGPNMEPDRVRLDMEELPDGSGFTLSTGIYSVDAGSTVATKVVSK